MDRNKSRHHSGYLCRLRTNSTGWNLGALRVHQLHISLGLCPASDNRYFSPGMQAGTYIRSTDRPMKDENFG